MTNSLLRVSLLSLLTWVATSCVMAGVEARSRPVGFLVQTIPAGQTRSFSVPFDAEVSALPGGSGRLSAVGSNYLECATAHWTPGAFTTDGAPYFVRLTSGANAGRIFRIVSPANTATRIYVADDGIGLGTLGLETGASGTGFDIMAGDTLASFFGTASTNTLVVQGAADPTQADIVQVWGGAAWLNFYYNTTWQRWARDLDLATDPSRNSFLLRPDRGLMITRRGATPLELTVVGRVLATPQRAFHARQENALTLLATMQTGNITLGDLALQSSGHASGWRGAADWTQADLLVVWSGTSWLAFFYNSASGHWERTGDPVNRDGFMVRAGQPVFIQRRTAGASSDDKTINFPAPGS